MYRITKIPEGEFSREIMVEQFGSALKLTQGVDVIVLDSKQIKAFAKYLLDYYMED